MRRRLPGGGGLGLEASNDTFINDVLLPTLPKVDGGFRSPLQEHAGEVANLATA